MDVCVSIAHCKKVVFTFLPFYLFTFLNIIQLHSFTISSTGPFQSVSGKGHFLLIVFFGGYLIHKTSIIATLMLYRCIF